MREVPASLDERGLADVVGAERLVTQARLQRPRTTDQRGSCSIMSAPPLTSRGDLRRACSPSLGDVAVPLHMRRECEPWFLVCGDITRRKDYMQGVKQAALGVQALCDLKEHGE